jgi:hypothetical protein
MLELERCYWKVAANKSINILSHLFPPQPSLSTTASSGAFLGMDWAVNATYPCPFQQMEIAGSGSNPFSGQLLMPQKSMRTL